MTTENTDKTNEESVLDDLIDETASKQVEYIENKAGGNLKDKADNNHDDASSTSTPSLEPEQTA